MCMCVCVRARLQLLERIETAQTEAPSRRGALLNFTPAQKGQLHRLKRCADMLEVSLMRLDESIALFNDY